MTIRGWDERVLRARIAIAGLTLPLTGVAQPPLPAESVHSWTPSSVLAAIASDANASTRSSATAVVVYVPVDPRFTETRFHRGTLNNAPCYEGFGRIR
jgi:hypothetical protein